MRRIVVGVIALLSVMAGLTTVGNPVEAAVSGDEFRGEDVPIDLRWVSCYEEIGPDFECAVARVPLDYDRLNGGKIPIQMVRLPATGGEPIGSLFLNPGGPGGSGINFVLGAGPFLYTPEVRANYDLIGVDPRGINLSNPLLCFGSLNAAFANLAPLAYPITEAEEKLWRQSDSYIRTQCRNNGGIIQNKMSTGNFARDLEVLRAAVGDDKLNFAGYSYGSIVGQVYAGLFPDRVGRLIIDGVLDIRDWVGDPSGRSDTTLEQRLQTSPAADEVWQQFVEQCEAAGPDFCAMAPDAAARTQAVLDQLAEEPLVFVDPETGQILFFFTYNDLIGNMLGAMYGAGEWTFLALFFADIEFLLSVGADASPGFAASVARDHEALQERLGLAPKPPKYPNFIEGFPGVACTDASKPTRFDAWADAADAAELEAPIFGRIWTWSDSICHRWPGKDADRFVGPYDAVSATTILVLTTRYDPATSYGQAVKASDGLANSTLVEVPGWGHTTLFTSTCADALTEAYLVDGVVPADGTVCPVDIGRPFQLSLEDLFGPGAEADAKAAFVREANRIWSR